MPRERAGFLPLMRTVHTANSTGVVDFPTEPAKRNNLSARFCFANQKPWNCRDAVHPNSKICAIFDTFKHNCASFNPYVGVRFSLMTLFFAFVLNFECAFLTLAHRRRMDGYTVKSAALPYRAREPRLYNRNRTIILNLSATFAAIRLCVCFCVGSSTSPETSKRKLSCDKWIMVVFVGGGERERERFSNGFLLWHVRNLTECVVVLSRWLRWRRRRRRERVADRWCVQTQNTPS